MAACVWGRSQENKPPTPTFLCQRLFRSDQGIVSQGVIPALTQVSFGKPSGGRVVLLIL